MRARTMAIPAVVYFLGGTMAFTQTRAPALRRQFAVEATAFYDVAVVGAGPAGSVIGWALAERHGKSVVMIDSAVDAKWPNNYGVWRKEWEALAALLPELDLLSCVSHSWKQTDCFFGGSWGVDVAERTRLDIPYFRIDRVKLKDKLRSRAAQFGVQCVSERVSAVRHDAAGTELDLVSGGTVRAFSVVDASGGESFLTPQRIADEPQPGYQIAFGIECLVDNHNAYDKESMLLFDYRTDHLTPAEQKDSPTFMYAMPLGVDEKTGLKRVFFEETSLVARPALSVKECERRCYARLKHLGISVKEVEDFELCYIPMGGSLPRQQRVVPYGAAARMVHPSTGYQLCRGLAGAPACAAALAAASSKGPDAAAEAAYVAVWNRKTVLQREFQLFGGEFLMTLDAEALRGWFGGFFQLEEATWGGFLAGWPQLPGNTFHETRAARLLFGVSLLVRLPPELALRLATFIAAYTFKFGPSLLRSVTPFFGDGMVLPSEADEDFGKAPGDAAVKAEIAQRRREMTA
ncbi:lycopene cyclase protein-domain-containing protein [Pelagophyceae sp. CCMP2097]|nr:lycopene cyclase protein-domain-containing protein [Pelagophyceae sp. CCMP2097]|mmetsp:Transcript_20863/g.71778  ORF Transcript_20863/g.71778 Transcript_20863/m.71778 type:complete len:519 (+) Transcript_20863:133-1689(+)